MDASAPGRPQRDRRMTEKGAAQLQEKTEKLRKQEENRCRKVEKTTKVPLKSHNPTNENLGLVVSHSPTCYVHADAFS